MNKNDLIPIVCKITKITDENDLVKTFQVQNLDNSKPFNHKCGQCAMLSYPSISEAMISISSSPSNDEFLEFTIKKVGFLTEYIHSLEVGQEITIRGPLGKPFPVEEEFKNKDLIFIAGGIGLAPLRSIINYVKDFRKDFNKITIIYGSKNPEEIIFKDDLYNNWKIQENFDIHLTIDSPSENWNGHVGYIPNFIDELNLNNNSTVILCGPPIMIKLVSQKLIELNFDKNKIYTTLEMRMKCGLGKCGRCNIGSKYVCKDGPVFKLSELEYLPDEY